jgi:hypothetical protein
MQATTRVHDGVPHPIRHETDVVFHDAITFHATNRVFHPHADGGHATMGRLLRRGQCSSRWCVLGLHARHVLQGDPLEAFILIQATAGWQGTSLPVRPGSSQRLSLHRGGSRNTRDRSPGSRGGCCACAPSSCRGHMLVALQDRSGGGSDVQCHHANKGDAGAAVRRVRLNHRGTLGRRSGWQPCLVG